MGRKKKPPLELPWRKREQLVIPEKDSGYKLDPLVARLDKAFSNPDIKDKYAYKPAKPKGRPKGERRPTPPLSEAQVKVIKTNTHRPKSYFVHKYGVSYSTVNKALKGEYDHHYVERKNPSYLIKKEGLEGTFKAKKVIPFLKSLPKTTFWTNHIGNDSGRPDMFILLNGVFIAMEIKRNIKELSTARYHLQKQVLLDIHRYKGIGIVVFPENWRYVKEWLKRVSAIRHGSKQDKRLFDYEYIDKFLPYGRRRK